FGRAGGQGSSNFGRGKGKGGGIAESGGFANLDFLPEGSVVVANLAADKDGVIQVDRAALGANQHVHVVAVDPQNTVYRQVALEQADAEYKDLRLIRGLDPQKHFTEKKQVGVVAKGGAFGIGDITTSRFESYDTLAKVYSLYATLSGNAHLIEFSFILSWPELKEEQKREKYSKYACHELNFFLYHKDRPFFDKVIRPYLANKKDSTFMDQWLLEADLSYHRQAWSHQRLNIVERVLLGRRVAAESAAATRHVTDLHDLIPPDIDRFNFLFKTAIKGSALEVGGEFGQQRDKALKHALLELQSKNERGASGLGALHRYEADKKSMVAGGTVVARPGSSRSDYSNANGIVDQAQKGARPAPPATAEPPAPQDEAAESESLALGDAREHSRNQALDRLRRKSKESRDADGDDALYFKANAEERKSVRQFYRKLEATMEWVENNYYKLPIEQQLGSLVTVNGFWRDYAAHQGDGPFLSAHLAESSRNFAEMMMALSVLDLPFKAGEHEMKFAEGRMDLSTASPMVVYHKQILPTEVADEATQVLVSQNFFRRDDRYRHENNQRLDKYVTEEFLVHTVYGCQVVITNPTSAPQKLDVLLQIPRGAIPVLNGQYTRSLHVNLQPYHTQTVEYSFYFPAKGKYLHYPVHVARNQDLIAHTAPFTFNVVEELSKIDTTSWAYLSQHGTEEQVIDYLKKNNINRLDLGKIAWRVQAPAFFDRVIPILNKRHVYHHTLWSYALKHNRLASLR
ncbi:MAG: hypothetical protein OER86_13625, partial [Phycisphaerae bacterium]|nr:hypothetical protein [Phycisphaerae bacterium]